MEQKLNIAEILKNKPRGTKLYSMIHGKCSSEAVTDEIFKINFCTSKFGLTQSGECTLIKFGNMAENVLSSHLRKCVIGLSSNGDK